MRELLQINGEAVEASVLPGQEGAALVRLSAEEHALSAVRCGAGEVEFDWQGRRYRFHAVATRDTVLVTDGQSYWRFARVEEGAAESGGEEAGTLTSQMPGTVLSLLVAPGAAVTKGTPLLILEAMKMEHEVCAPAEGRVEGFPKQPGERVMPGDLLVEFTRAE